MRFAAPTSKRFIVYNLIEQRKRRQASAVIVPSYSAEATAISDALTVKPSAGQMANIDALTGGLVADGIWSKLGLLYIFEGFSQEFALLNWKTPGTAPCLISGTVTFTPAAGFSTDGTTGFVSPNVFVSAIPNYAQNSASFGVMVNVSTTSPSLAGSVAAGAGLLIGRGGTSLVTRINCGTSTTQGTVTASALNMLSVARDNPSTYDRYINDAAQTPGAVASASPVNVALTFGRANNAFAPNDAKFFAGFAGSFLTAAEIANLNTRLRAYLNTVGVS